MRKEKIWRIFTDKILNVYILILSCTHPAMLGKINQQLKDVPYN